MREAQRAACPSPAFLPPAPVPRARTTSYFMAVELWFLSAPPTLPCRHHHCPHCAGQESLSHDPGGEYGAGIPTQSWGGGRWEGWEGAAPASGQTSSRILRGRTSPRERPPDGSKGWAPLEGTPERQSGTQGQHGHDPD